MNVAADGEMDVRRKMMIDNKTITGYTIAIRTLGTAGDKFLAQLDSLHKLVPAPESINVYIPHGYTIPEVPYLDVKFFRCDKGMVAQRALPFDEIKTEWILFLDDDIVVPPDGVERLFRVAKEMSADCVSVDHEAVNGFAGVLKRIVVSGWWPHRDASVAFKVGKNGEYTYCRHPERNGMATECVCFQNFLVRKSAHLAVHLEEERWMDRFGYALHDELVYAKKLIGNGYKIATYFADDFLHLDGKSGHVKISARSEARKFGYRFAAWHRNVYNTEAGGLWASAAFASFMIRQYLMRGARCLLGGQPSFFWLAFSELRDARRFTRSAQYRVLGPVDKPTLIPAYNPCLAEFGNRPRERLLQRLWKAVRFFTWGLTPWFARRWRLLWFRMFGGKAGRGVSLGARSKIDFPWNISIGSFSSIADGALVRALREIKIGRNVCISEDAKILTGSHDVSSPHFDSVLKPVAIGDSVWIAMNAIIMPGVTIGEGAVVAAGAVVTKDVEPWTVVAGIPAKVVKKRTIMETKIC